MNKKMIKTLLSCVLVVAVFGVIQMQIASGGINRYDKGILMICFINIILSVSLNLVSGYLGQLTLGHAGFMSVGAYASAILTIKLNTVLDLPMMIQFPLSLIFGGLMAALAGILIGVPALRLKGDYLAIITLGFGEIIRVLILNIDNMIGFTLTGGARNLKGIPNYTSITSVYWLAVLFVLLLYLLIHSRHGRSIIAIKEDEIAAEASGIPTTYYKIFAFTVAAFIAGIGGGLYAHYISVLDATKFDYNYSIDILVMVVLGGLGNMKGTILAAVLLTVLPERLRFFGQYRMIIYALLLVVIMIMRNSDNFSRLYYLAVRHINQLRDKVLAKFRKSV